jgi:hypothetical protein
MKLLSITFWLSIHLAIGVALMTAIVKPNVIQGIEQSLRIGITK